MNENLQSIQLATRRQFLKHCNVGLGALAMAALAGNGASAAPLDDADNPLAPKAPPLPAKVKRVIYLHMSGAPPQHDLFDYKPKLVEHNLQPCPDDLLAILQKERLPFIVRRAGRRCWARRTSSRSAASRAWR